MSDPEVFIYPFLVEFCIVRKRINAEFVAFRSIGQKIATKRKTETSIS